MLVCFKLYVKNAKTTAVRYLHEGLTVSDKLLREAKIEERIATLKQEKIFFNNQYLYYTKITPKSHRFQHLYKAGITRIRKIQEVTKLYLGTRPRISKIYF